MRDVDVAVVGAGPAGLAAAVAAVEGGCSTVVFDEGRRLHERDQVNPSQLISGVGGAGLYSDGKFSFYPSATRLWSLQPRTEVELAYSWLLQTLARVGWTRPGLGFPDSTEAVASGVEKSYPSYYATPEERAALTELLVTQLSDALCTETSVDDVKAGDPHRVVVRQVLGGGCEEIRARSVVIASGRLGPLRGSPHVTSMPMTPRRYEVGVRLEEPSTEFVLRTHSSLDPKVVLAIAPGIEFRTFCCCREGEVVMTDLDGVRTVSGRADCPPTGRSNVGLNLRFAGWDEEGLRIVERALAVGEHVSEFATTVLRHPERTRIGSALGETGARALRVGLDGLLDHCGSRLSQTARLHGMAIEGVGSYPDVGDDLRVGARTWVAGDACGLFRGLTAAFVSGYFCGRQVARSLRPGQGTS